MFLARGPCPNALVVAPASLFSKMHRCHHPLCCLFVNLACIVWVVSVHHFFKNALVSPFLGLHACWSCTARASLFIKMGWCYHPCAACPRPLLKSSGCSPCVTFFKNALGYHPLVPRPSPALLLGPSCRGRHPLFCLAFRAAPRVLPKRWRPRLRAPGFLFQLLYNVEEMGVRLRDPSICLP